MYHGYHFSTGIQPGPAKFKIKVTAAVHIGLFGVVPQGVFVDRCPCYISSVSIAPSTSTRQVPGAARRCPATSTSVTSAARISNSTVLLSPSSSHDKSYACSMCLVRFAQGVTVAPHERTHTG